MSEQDPQDFQDSSQQPQNYTPPETVEVSDEEKFADQLTKRREELEALLLRLKAERDMHEAEEKLNASKSAMALVFELIGCEFWRYDPDNTQDKNVPPGRFVQHPCLYGKAHPDQDCRTCSHVQYARYGGSLPMYEKRYGNSGVVVPISEDEMDELAQWLKDRGLKPASRVQSKIHALEQILESAKANEEHARRVALEAQQRGQFPSSPQNSAR